MNRDAAISCDLSLTALRGAVGGVVGVGRAVDCWDQVVWLWRIFRQLDGLIALLWAMVHRIRAGELGVGGGCPAGAAAWGEPAVVAGSRRARLRAVAGVRAMPGRRGLAVASAGAARGGDWPAGFDWRGGGWGALPPVPAAWGLRFSDLGWDALQSCVLNVTI